MMITIRGILTLAFAALMIFAGVMHFLKPEPFIKIVPPYLPYASLLVAISGFFEILFGAGLLIPVTRAPAAWGLIALLIAVFPANIHMAIHQIPFGSQSQSPILLWVRLPLQFVLIFWAWFLTKK